MSSPRTLSLNQLREIAKDYATAFPGWAFYKDKFVFGLWRSCGPVRQNIWFGVMSNGRYRLSHEVTAFVPHLITIGDQQPWVGMLPQLLGITERLQSIRPSEHASRWRDVVAAMEREFKPDIRKPLRIAEIAELCFEEAQGCWDKNNLAMMATLHAWLGKRDDARQHCIRLQSLKTSPTPEMHDWDREMTAFALDLLKAVEAGKEREFLERMEREASSATGDAVNAGD